MKIQVLGTGCPKCAKLEKNARDAVARLGIDCTVEKVSELDRIVSLGVLLTPGLVIDGKVVSSGRVLPVKEIVSLLGGGEG